MAYEGGKLSHPAYGYPDDYRREAAALASQGVPVREVAKLFNVSRQSVYRWLLAFGHSLATQPQKESTK